MTDDTQPEAMDLADWLEAVGGGPSAKRCAALLREQHARIAELESELEAIGAGGVSGPLMGSASISANAGGPWTGGEEWEALAWHLCAEENGEDACGELLWEGGPIPEPWGDRWMKYESDAKRMIELVRKFVAAPPTAQAGGWTKASKQLPPCREDQLYIGINTAGFAGVFNAVRVVNGNTYCLMEVAEESVSIMSDLAIWKPFNPPTSAEGVEHG